jgi:hypothetical protein
LCREGNITLDSGAEEEEEEEIFILALALENQ